MLRQAVRDVESGEARGVSLVVIGSEDEDYSVSACDPLVRDRVEARLSLMLDDVRSGKGATRQ